MRQKLLLLLSLACACPLWAQINVSDASELADVATQCATDGCAGKTYVLTADIDLSVLGSWTPIGTSDKPFMGSFNGNGHLVKGLHLFNGTDGIGLFGHVGTDGRIDGVGICGSTLIAKNKRRIGALAGVCAGQINQCWSMAYLAAAGNVVGGLVGELTSSGSITDAYHSGLIYNANDTIGGIVGMNNGGTLTRVYNTGYAKNGKAIVGLDKGGKYPDCHYDRKLYYQESGIENDKATPVDVTEQMFALYYDNNVWWQDNERYPILKVFANTDAALLSAAPMLINKKLTDPVNHANDLTTDFALYTKNGIQWKCQDKRSEAWIQIFDDSVHVVRPCTETDVLVDSKKGTEVRVVYMRPRRVEDLQPGAFVPKNDNPLRGYCFQSNEPVSDEVYYSPASKGWTEADYHYMVIRYEITLTDTVIKDTLLYDANSVQYTAWYNTDTIPTDEPGHYIIRSFVHDEGCVQDWLENKSGLEYVIYREFDPGVITSGTDTVILTKLPYPIQVKSQTDASGGGGKITYEWKNKTAVLPNTDQASLTYSITQSGIYSFTRTARDSAGCCGDNTAAEGVYMVYAFDPLDPGKINAPNDIQLCTAEDAKDIVATATAASGGVTDKGYSYQWYRVVGTDTTAVPGATSRDLKLQNLVFEAGQTYIFVRKVWDNTRFTTWTLSRNELRVYINQELKPGAIQDGAMEAECVAHDATPSTSLNVTILQTEAASGESTLEYLWVRNPGNTPVGNTPELDYTFPLSEIELNTTYTYVRYVRNPGCQWLQSAGTATRYYGRKTYGEVTITVCDDQLPYSMTWVDGKTYTFTTAGETQLLSDTRGDCPADTLFRIVTATMPAFKMDTVARFCQETGTITLNFVVTDGSMNVYKVTYSPALADIMGTTGATGIITTDNTVLLKNIPPLGIGDYYIDMQLGYTDDLSSDAGVCFSTAHRMQLKPSLGGYVHTKYNRVLFVDNNPDNNLIPGAAEKLKFVAYQWYRNGLRLEGETQQYYHEGGRTLDGIYYVELTSENGGRYRSCDVEIHPDSASSMPPSSLVYPVPVNAGQVLTIEAEGTVLIRSFAGETVVPATALNGKLQIAAPYIAGIYYVQITLPDGTVEMHKLIVK